MIDGLRRRLGKQVEKGWGADEEIHPDAEEVSEIHTDTAVLLAATKMADHPASNDVNMRDYYKGVILVAIQQGGSYQGQQISMPWLRMILAGLEMRPIAPEMMWEGDGEIGVRGALNEIPSYDDLFPTAAGSPPQVR